ncbi:MAG: LysM peptidoglycan-binding domain-containing protein [Spirochaetes bacterium]|nr:LysM peptidoglycan-binding domain-containing protein [Spirochaetota bacterium]
MRNIFGFGIALSVLFLAACGDPVPLGEMSSAKMMISKSQTVRAEKYAPDEYNEAAALLLEAHSLVKDEKYDDAAKKALVSKEKAQAAYDKAAPLMAKDSIDIADQSIKSADEVFASELAKDEYEAAVNKQKLAQTDFESKQYESAYKNAVEADSLAKNARNTAISGKGMIEDSINEVKATLAEAKKYNAEKLAPEKYNAAVESLTSAQKSYDALALKEAFAYLDEAKASADEAYQAALKETALDKIEQAKQSISDAESTTGAKEASADFQASKELAETAEMQYNEGNYLDSIDSSNESLRLSGLVSQAGSSADKYAKDSGSDADSSDVIVSESSEKSEDYDIYKVKYNKNPPKDCLWIISKKFYKNPRKWKKIYNANKDVIKNPDYIFPGWKLKIPKESK